MKYRQLFFFILAIFAVFSTFEAKAAQGRVVSLVTLANYPPFCYAKPGAVNRGREVIAPGADSDYLQGKVWDRVKSAYHDQGYTIILQVLPWRQAEQAVRMGGDRPSVSESKKPKSYYDLSFEVAKVSLYDSSGDTSVGIKPQRGDLMFPALKTPDRVKEFDFSQSAVNDVQLAIYVSKQSGLDLSGKDSLKGKKIGVMRGWNYGKLFASLDGYVPVEFDSIEAGFRALRTNRVAAFAGFREPFDMELERIKWKKFFKSFKAKDEIPEFLCGIKDAPRTKLLLGVYDLSKRNNKR